MRTMTDDSDDAFTSFNVRSEMAEWADSEEARISPKRKEPKKAQALAVQITCFVSGSQSVFAILVPRFVKSGKVTTLLVLFDGVAIAILDAPFSSCEMAKSEEMWSCGMPRKLCTNFNADR